MVHKAPESSVTIHPTISPHLTIFTLSSRNATYILTQPSNTMTLKSDQDFIILFGKKY